ncbi:ester cyclase [Izhakiella australiensis]|uniref:Ester cyclase n=1 Tax=Izhakiella australiensis TaxID=1926881 RepID=A0A1S8YS37_9GAMM|nr:ester cyclase [Izhakiella australiensis]OON42001.1 ester cyclase [Izhakiella australiensis]
MSSLDQQQLDAQRHAVETIYRAFSENKPDLLNDVVTPDWQDIPLAPGQAPGPAGLKPIIAAFVSAMPDVTIIIHELMQLPNKIAVRAEIRGTHQGEIFGIPASGKAVSFSLHEFHHLQGDKVVTTWHQEDWLSFFHQVGQFPPVQ